MKVLYLPFRVIAGVIGARLGRRVFGGLWGKIDPEEPPGPTVADASFSKILAGAVLEAGTLAFVAAAVDWTSARVFHYLTGIWPGEKTSGMSGDN